MHVAGQGVGSLASSVSKRNRLSLIFNRKRAGGPHAAGSTHSCN